MQNYVKMEINEENCKSFENGRKVMKLLIITPQFQTNKQTNEKKKKNLLTLTVSCEKKSSIIRKINK